ncbi:hypothetical protein D3C75_133710 [compost metagenome]
MAVSIRVGRDKARAVIHEVGGLMHHVPVVGAGFPDNHEVRVDVGNGETGFIQFMDQRAFAHHVGLFAFLTAQEIGGGHGGGIKRAFRDFKPGGGEAVRQILRRLRWVVGQHHQRHALFLNPRQEKIGAGNWRVVMQQHAVDITYNVFDCHCCCFS